MNSRYLLLVCLLSIVSCAIDQPVTQSEPQAVPITISMESLTKTHLDGKSIIWDKGDQVSVFDGVANNQFVTEAEGPNVDFNGIAVPGGEITVLYPYNPDASISNSQIYTTIPVNQKATVGTFAPQANISACIAQGTGTNLSARMCNVGCYLKFVVEDINSGIRRVEVIGRAGESLAGPISISFESGLPLVTPDERGIAVVISNNGKTFDPGIYYLVMAPCLLSDGLKVTLDFDDEKSQIYHLTGVHELVRNGVYSLGNIIDAQSITHEGLADEVEVSKWTTWTDASSARKLLQQAADEGKVYFSDYKYYNYESYNTLRGKCAEYGYPLMFSADVFKASSSYYPAEETAKIRANLISVIKEAWAQSRCLPLLSWHIENPYADYEALGGVAPARYRYGTDEFPDYPRTQRYVVRHILNNTNGKGDWFDERCRDVADIINSLVDINGKPIPVVFRLFHECEHNWAWWQMQYYDWNANCSVSEYISLFQLAVTKFRTYCPEAQILFCFNKDRSFNTEESFLKGYPGDDYVDIMSWDDYSIGNSSKVGTREETINNMLVRSRIVTSCAQSHGKIAALFETNNNSEDETEQATFYSDFVQTMLKDSQTELSFMGMWAVNLTGDLRKQAFGEFIKESNIIFDR